MSTRYTGRDCHTGPVGVFLVEATLDDATFLLFELLGPTHLTAISRAASRAIIEIYGEVRGASSSTIHLPTRRRPNLKEGQGGHEDPVSCIAQFLHVGRIVAILETVGWNKLSDG
ncbi:hypothetical protein O1611_g8554 [Lasiodiplodia mahajangana]|uniref:Uncharacterized protein n=1 Tax=Lasiodiplodia mahajangana TaxID=1108764 RepID=A0ACC2JC59_9PEZI|nr:hypothetical protein O1611_g8554 [Lasiodiplodia mahajangana]